MLDVNDVLITYMCTFTIPVWRKSFCLQISEALKVTLSSTGNETDVVPTDEVNFRSLQYALFTTCFVEVIGGFFFLVTAFYITADKIHVEKTVHGNYYCSIN